jgi:hypothetical protein
MHGTLAKLMNRKQERRTAAPGSTFQVGPRSSQRNNPHLAQANRFLEMEEYEAAEGILRRLSRRTRPRPTPGELASPGAGPGPVRHGEVAQKARRQCRRRAVVASLYQLPGPVDRGTYLNESAASRDPRCRGPDRVGGCWPAPIADLAITCSTAFGRRVVTDRRW